MRVDSRPLARVLVLTLLPAAFALAGDKYLKNDEPVFPALQEDRALVYFARTEFMRLIPLETYRLYVDDGPAGYLPQRSYLTAQVEPGRRLIWGTSASEPQSFDFKAGETYLLVLRETYMASSPGRVLSKTEWQLGDPADIRALVTSAKLSYVTTTEVGLAALRERANSGKYEAARKEDARVQPAELPVTFSNVWYRAGNQSHSLKTWGDATGVLTVDSGSITFVSKDKNLSIAVKDVASVSYDQVSANALAFDPTPWATVRFNSADSQQIAYFRDRVIVAWDEDDSKRIYHSLQAALQTAQNSPTPAIAATPALPVGYVTYQAFQNQFTLAIPEGWMAYDQNQALKGAPGLFGLIFFLPKENSAEIGGQRGLESADAARRLSVGDIPSFFVERVPAADGMSCTGFSAKATKDLLRLFTDNELFGKDARIVRAPHAEPTPVAGCSGLKLEGSAQPAGGREWMVTAYVAAEAHTMYMFALRNYTENYARTSGVFEQAVSTARIQPTQ